jgi:hypothetical protein
MTFSERGSILLHYLTKPPRRPMLQLSVYLAALTAVGSVLIFYVPAVANAVAEARAVPVGGGELRDLLVEQPRPVIDALQFDLRMAIVMLGTMFVTIPFSWGYMAIRERTGYEQSVVQTLVILPIVVAAIMMIVQTSLALAFALGGVAAAVRFRNTLKDVADATYVFLAIGIGIAAGTGALTAALVMSALFTYASVLLWRCQYGECDLSRVTVGSDPIAAGPGERASRLPRQAMTVEIQNPGARALVEGVLRESTKRWKVQRKSRGDAGETVLKYAFRLKRSQSIDALTTAMLVHRAAGVGVPRFTAAPPASEP